MSAADTVDAADVAAIEALCHRTVRASVQRGGWVPVDDHTPVLELYGREAGVTGSGMSEEARTRSEVILRFLMWAAGDGLAPARVIRRIFAAMHVIEPGLLAHMTQADLALMLGESKAAFSWRTLKLFEGKIHARSMKRALARQRYSAAQQGNTNRRTGVRREEARREEAERRASTVAAAARRRAAGRHNQYQQEGCNDE